jgi:hypothetical protein
MPPPAQLTGPNQRTYEAIFQHPVPHNLGWRDVHALLRKLGEIAEEPNGNLRVTRHGQTLTLHPPLTKDVAAIDEIMALRHFLERSSAAISPAPGTAVQWLVVISHREALIYRSVESGTVPQQIRPHAREDYFRHAPNSADFSRGQEKPDPGSFFEPVAGVLNGAGRILVFGNGTGTGSELDQFVLWLKRHRPALAARIVGTETIDSHHLTEGQILAKAREFFAASAAGR